jgi:hypothetical protein
MQLLRDNLTLWTSDLADAAKEGDDQRNDWENLKRRAERPIVSRLYMQFIRF